jgi:CRISPR system Cascade subunit CasE
MGLPLYLLRAELDPRALLRFAQVQGLNHAHDEDLGYAVHAWLAAGFGAQALKPFRLFDPRGPRLRLLGYSTRPSGELAERLGAAPPEVRRVLEPCHLAQARLPDRWRSGRRLGFEVLACPVTRQGQAEKDVFLRRLERVEPGESAPDRGPVYRDWLAAQLEGAARLEQFRLDGFSLVRVLRRTQPDPSRPERAASTLTRPRALCRGILTVRDGERFQALLQRGLGRHRAFGYGLLLLRPER